MKTMKNRDKVLYMIEVITLCGIIYIIFYGIECMVLLFGR